MEAQEVLGIAEMCVSLTDFHFGPGNVLEPSPIWLVPEARTTFRQLREPWKLFGASLFALRRVADMFNLQMVYNKL